MLTVYQIVYDDRHFNTKSCKRCLEICLILFLSNKLVLQGIIFCESH